MKTFTDNTGRTWTLSVTVGTIKRVRALCGVDLANIISIEAGKAPNVGLLDRLASDPASAPRALMTKAVVKMSSERGDVLFISMVTGPSAWAAQNRRRWTSLLK